MAIEEHIHHPDGRVEVVIKKECKDYMKYFLYFITTVIVLMLITNIAAFAIIVKFLVTSTSKFVDGVEKAMVTISCICYGLMAVAAVLAEIQRPLALFKRAQFLYFWGARGALEMFIGVIVISSTKQMGSALAAELGTDSDPMITFALISGWMVIGGGAIRVLLSVCCVRDWVSMEDDALLKSEMEALLNGGTVVHTRNIVQNEILQSIVPVSATNNKELNDLETFSKHLAIALGLDWATAKKNFFGKDGEANAYKYFKEHEATKISL